MTTPSTQYDDAVLIAGASSGIGEATARRVNIADVMPLSGEISCRRREAWGVVEASRLPRFRLGLPVLRP